MIEIHETGQNKGDYLKGLTRSEKRVVEEKSLFPRLQTGIDRIVLARLKLLLVVLKYIRTFKVYKL